jgi:hypothetical protein
MAGYDITPIDVPGILSAYTGAQDRRVNQMLMKRKMDMEDRAVSLQNQKMDLAAKAFGLQPGGGGQPSTSGGLAAPYASPPAASPVTAPAASLATPYAAPSSVPSVATIDRNRPTGSPLSPMTFPDQTITPAYPVVAPQTLVDPAALPPRTDGLKLNQDALRQLYVLDPDMAKGLQDMAFNADKKQFEAMARNGEVMATAAYDIKRLPPERRRAEVAALVPYLIQNGVPADLLTPQSLDQMDLSDAGLDRLITTGRKLGDVIKDDQENTKFAETIRHNKATEGVASGNLAVREGALGLAKGREGRIASGGGKSGGSNTSGMSNDAILGNLLGR